jgi:type IV fimbrial biogenesis protein FimT
MRSKARGFTLIELLVVMAIMAIMAGLATPALQSFVAAQRVKTAASDFAVAAIFARSEAIKRNASVSIEAASGGWQNGWTVKLGAVTLSTQQPYKRLAMTATTTPETSSFTQIVYQSSGRLSEPQQAPKLTIKDDIGGSDSESASRSRCVQFELSGLPRTLKGAAC